MRMVLDLKGLHTTSKTLKDGTRKTYYYAWRGGPPIAEEFAHGTPEFVKEFERLRRERVSPDMETLAGLVQNYRLKELPTKKPGTQKIYEPLLNSIVSAHGTMPVAAIEELGSRVLFEKWRDEMSDTPGKAKLAWAVLGRVFSFSVRKELLKRNPCTGGSGYKTRSRREIIWTDAEIDLFCARASERMVQAMILAVETGQRKGDLLRLTWNAYDGKRISLKQEKTGKHVSVLVSSRLKSTLASMDRKAVTILTSSLGTPWTSDGFRAAWNAAMAKAGIEGKRFHDLRGTFITRARRAGVSVDDIAHASGHSKTSASAILEAHYLATDQEVADAVILKMEKAKK